MGDIGSAFSSGLSGLSSGVSDLGSGLSSMFGGGDALSSAMGGMDTSGLSTDSMFSNLGSDAFDDPTGSAGASQAMTPPADIAAAGPNTDPASTIGGSQTGAQTGTNQNQGQGQSQNQQNQNPLSQVWKNLQGMGKALAGGAQKANPFQTGGGGGGGAQAQPGPTATPGGTPTQPPQPSPGGTSVTAGANAPSDAGMDPEIAARQAGAAPGQAGGPGAAATSPAAAGGAPAQPGGGTPTARPGNQGPESLPGGNVGAGPTQGSPGTTPPAGGASIPSSTGTGAGGAPNGQGAPTNGMGGIGNILRDILGLAMGGPAALPQLAQDLMGMMGGQGMAGMMGQGGQGGGMPPWAMQSMMPFMRGRRGGFMGFNGGNLRPGYYPNRMNGNRFGFHQGGFHPGWNPMAGGGGSSGGGGASGRWSGSGMGGSVMGRGRMDPTAVRGLASQLQGAGIPREAVPGVIAGLMGESGQGLDPRSFNSRDPGGSGGIGQWNRGRLTGPSGMLAFAQNHGVNVDPMNARDAEKVPRDVQQAYLMSELQGPRFAGLMQNLRNSRDPYAALQNWVNIYENPQDKSGAINQRRQYISAIASILNQGGGDGGTPAPASGGDATASTTPTPPIRTQPWYAPGVQTTPNVQDASGGDAQA